MVTPQPRVVQYSAAGGGSSSQFEHLRQQTEQALSRPLSLRLSSNLQQTAQAAATTKTQIKSLAEIRDDAIRRIQKELGM